MSEGKEVSRDLLSRHDAIAKFAGSRHFPCRFMTALCPDKCGHATDAFVFEVVQYLDFKKPGQYGDDKQDVYHLDSAKAKPSEQPFIDIAKTLSVGDVVRIAWVHDYVTLEFEPQGSSSFPERIVTKLTPLPQLTDLLTKEKEGGKAGRTDAKAFQDAVSALQALYGGPSSLGMGTAVFLSPLPAAAGSDGSDGSDGFEAGAREAVHTFYKGPVPLTDVWEKLLDSPSPVQGGVLQRLDGVSAQADSINLEMLVDQMLTNIEGSTEEGNRAAIAALFDSAGCVGRVCVWACSDGHAMQGVVVGAVSATGDQATYLLFTMD
mmetsp:Transcript_15192/g.32947  ORF Transcript_15192/g.32947 Transcript_15192/m.32947 type:complete len:320 (-) Transcript_15192:102-1061(-)|eukprot:CAMPEP_0202901794 /NCGR_PEP_ID=MMETSP1392-20130828/14704_1 /ASSEMBLY_ACC=CAM_ASM_000868 /TAXON_ID=225041 /ORGANISM="Chlamydomonas chlamydogama, Strain SAG 11-48b" /LENGTH=319 /DNA_ID=CAMNT_0049588411 /DNA_START=25 /DNA_END=984 /DNA_ORIENTATION=+